MRDARQRNAAGMFRNEEGGDPVMNARLAVAICLLFTVSALASDFESDLRASRDARNLAAEGGYQALAPTCPATTIIPPVTISGLITTNTCRDFLNLYDDVYAVTVATGQTIDIDFSSRSFEVFIYMYLNNGTSAPTTRVSSLSSGTSR